MNRIKWMYNNGYRKHHKALMRGYVSRKKDYVIKPYVGRFGIGFKVLQPRFDTTQYIDCTYFVLQESSCADVIVINKKTGMQVVFSQICKFRNGKKYYYFKAFGFSNQQIEKDKNYIRLEDWDKICD